MPPFFARSARTSAPLAPLAPARALAHPLWLGGLALLVLNDHVLKGSGALPGLVTGKLSDAAGMLVAPALAALVVRARGRHAVALCHLAVLVVFAAIKVSRPAADAVEALAGALGLRWRIWVDPSDLLVAVPALAASLCWLVPAMERPLALRRSARRLGELAGTTVGLLACMGTSRVPPVEPLGPPPVPPPPTQAHAQPGPALDVALLRGGVWQSGGPGTPTAYRFEADRYVYTADLQTPETGRFELVEASSTRLRLRLFERAQGHAPLPPIELALELAPDRRAFAVADNRGVGRVFQREPEPATVATDPSAATPTQP
ncbi:MAG: hypothetical protein HY908_37165 [Myxococcales bacterium]|nr:hypothetical protein [Myxococcales bacterium]